QFQAARNFSCPRSVCALDRECRGFPGMPKLASSNPEEPSSYAEDPMFWFSRAEEARVMAEAMHYAESRLALLRIAEIYTKLAERAQRRLTQDYGLSRIH